MLEAFPSKEDFETDQKTYAEVEWLKSAVSGIRNIRGESKIKPSTKIEILLQNGSEQDRNYVKNTEILLKRSANVDKISWLESNATPPTHALCLIGDLKLMVPLSGLIDLQGESNRIKKELNKHNEEVKRLEKKLSNNNFIQNAPNEVVEKEKNKLAELQASREILLQQAKDLENIESESN